MRSKLVLFPPLDLLCYQARVGCAAAARAFSASPAFTSCTKRQAGWVGEVRSIQLQVGSG